MTAQATAMPRQHPEGLTTARGDRRPSRRPLMTAAIALAAPLFAVTVLTALGAMTGKGGAGLGSLPGADGLKGESGTAAAATQPVDPDRSKDFNFKRDGGGAARKQSRSAPPEPGGRDTVEKLPARPIVPIKVGGGSPTVTEAPDPSAPGYPGGTTGGSGSTGTGSGSAGTGSGGQGSGMGSGTSGGTGSGVSGDEYDN
jgi:hypothetical protein